MTLNRIFKILQKQTTGGYDTFNNFRKGKIGKKIQHKRARQHIKFYDGFYEFVEENRKRNEKWESKEQL